MIWLRIIAKSFPEEDCEIENLILLPFYQWYLHKLS